MSRVARTVHLGRYAVILVIAGFLLPAVALLTWAVLRPDAGYMPRAACVLLDWRLILPMVAADAGTAIIYTVGLPVLVLGIVRDHWSGLSHLPRTDVVLWAAFIASCGWVHAAEAVNIFVAIPWTLAAVKAAMLLVSAAALVSTARNLPTYVILANGLARTEDS